MTTLEKGTVIVIDPDKEKAEKTRKILERSMEKIVVVNTRCLLPRFQEIKELVGDGNYLKVFYGCNEKFFNETVERFNLKRAELKYIGWEVDISQIIIYY